MPDLTDADTDDILRLITPLVATLLHPNGEKQRDDNLISNCARSIERLRSRSRWRRYFSRVN